MNIVKLLTNYLNFQLLTLLNKYITSIKQIIINTETIIRYNSGKCDSEKINRNI